MTEQEKIFIAREFDKLEKQLDSKYALYENGYQSGLFDALEVVNKLPIHSVSHRFSDDEIKEMALDMIYQMTGEKVPEEEQCRHQGNANYQIAMTYLTKVNGG